MIGRRAVNNGKGSKPASDDEKATDRSPARSSSPGLGFLKAIRRRSELELDTVETAGAHASNPFLQSMDFLADHAAVLQQIVPLLRPEYLVDLVLMLHVRGVLHRALHNMLALEALANVKKGVASETFRGESAAMLLTSAVLSLDTLVEFRQDFVGFAFGNILQRISWNPKQLGKVVCDCIKHLNKQVSRMPEELVILLKALGESSDTAQIQTLQPQIFFLRFICPGLAQPLTLGGLDAVPEEMAKSMLALAKALQLVANQVDPSEDSFAFPIKDVLRDQYPQVVRIFTAVGTLQRGRPSPPVIKSLVDPARYIYILLCGLGKFDDLETVAAFDTLKLHLGEPGDMGSSAANKIDTAPKAAPEVTFAEDTAKPIENI